MAITYKLLDHSLVACICHGILHSNYGWGKEFIHSWQKHNNCRNTATATQKIVETESIYKHPDEYA